MSGVVRMVDADVDRVAPVLAKAFQADPLFAWVEPDGGIRALFLERFMRALAWRSHLYAEAWTTAPSILGASLWVGPDLGPLSAAQRERSGLDRADADLPLEARERLVAYDAVRKVVERVAPLPRVYLGVLAVDPAAQGRGLGDALIAPGLKRADAQGLPTTLETLNERNLAFYRRHGFTMAAQGRVPEDGPAYWVLRREPNPRLCDPEPL